LESDLRKRGGRCGVDRLSERATAVGAADRAAGESIYLFLRISPVWHGSGTYRYYQVYTAEMEG